jgi:hypothetical protein
MEQTVVVAVQQPLPVARVLLQVPVDLSADLTEAAEGQRRVLKQQERPGRLLQPGLSERALAAQPKFHLPAQWYPPHNRGS